MRSVLKRVGNGVIEIDYLNTNFYHLRKMKIEIQSVIDLITNSSTETFTILSDNAESLIKEVVNSILLAAKSELTFSDLFVYKEEFNDRWEDDYRGSYIRNFIEDEDTSKYGKVLLKIYDMASDKFSYWEGENGKALDFIYEEIKKVAIDNGALTYNEFCEQENSNCDYMPALKTFYIEVKEGLDNEDAKLAANALNSLELLYSADYYCG